MRPHLYSVPARNLSNPGAISAVLCLYLNCIVVPNIKNTKERNKLKVKAPHS